MNKRQTPFRPPHSKHVVVPKIGHFSLFRAPDITNQPHGPRFQPTGDENYSKLNFKPHPITITIAVVSIGWPPQGEQEQPPPGQDRFPVNVGLDSRRTSSLGRCLGEFEKNYAKLVALMAHTHTQPPSALKRGGVVSGKPFPSFGGRFLCGKAI